MFHFLPWVLQGCSCNGILPVQRLQDWPLYVVVITVPSFDFPKMLTLCTGAFYAKLKKKQPPWVGMYVYISNVYVIFHYIDVSIPTTNKVPTWTGEIGRAHV